MALNFTFAENLIKFSDPSKVIKMSSAWQQKSINYKQDNIDLRVSLDQQQYPYLAPLIEQFAKSKDVTIVVENGTCGISAGKLRRKEIDVGGFCCPPGKLDRLPGLNFHTVGIASLAIISNIDIPVSSVSLQQAKNIFNGEIETWSEIDSKIIKVVTISPIVRPHCNKRPGHWRLIVPTKSEFSRRALTVGSIPDMLKRVSGAENSVGYESLWMIEQNIKNSPVKILNIDGVKPNNYEALKQGQYPFYRTFNLTLWDNAKPLAIELVKFVKQQVNITENKIHTLVGIDQLKQNGWVFNNHELLAEPKLKTKLLSQK